MDAVTFGQPRVGDKEFVRHLDEDLPNLNYARVVHGGDLFARVPTSGYWLPTSNEGRFAVEYAHAGSMLWTDANDENGSSATTHLYRAKGEQDPAKFMRDARCSTRSPSPIITADTHDSSTKTRPSTTLGRRADCCDFCVPLRSMRTRKSALDARN